MLLEQRNNYLIISSTDGLITKNTQCLNDYKLFLRIIIMKNNINSNYTYSFVQKSVNIESVYESTNLYIKISIS